MAPRALGRSRARAGWLVVLTAIDRCALGQRQAAHLRDPGPRRPRHDLPQAAATVGTGQAAPSQGGYERLGGFLYRVAYRLALRARANEARRRRCEARAAQSRADQESPDASQDDLVVAAWFGDELSDFVRGLSGCGGSGGPAPGLLPAEPLVP